MKALRWIWKVIRQVAENDLQNHAAEMSYFSMMAVFPFFLLLTTVVAFLPIPDLFGETMDLLREIAPEEVVRLLEETIFEVTTIKKTNLLSATLIVCIWMSSGAMSSTTRGLNKAFGLKDPRHYARFFGLSLLMTFMLGMLLIIGIVIIMLGPKIEGHLFEYVDLGKYGRLGFKVLRNLIPLFFLFVAHAGIYWLCPAMKKKFRIFSPGTLFSVTSWILVSVGFKLYLEQVNNYDKLYGSLGAVILCLVWFYIMSFVLLIGGQIDAVLHPEYKAPVREDVPVTKEPLPWKLVAISVAVLILVPLGIKKFLTPASFVPIPQEVGGKISNLAEKSMKEGTQRFSNLAFTEILKKHVDETGKVDYTALAADMKPLKAYLDSVARADISRFRPEDLQATMINLYHATALRMVVEGGQELTTLRDVGNVFTRPSAKVAGQDISLKDIRDGILRVYFADDPRQLLALSELGQTPPRLQQYAFEGINLDKQLDAVARQILSKPNVTVKGSAMTLPYVFARFRPSFEKAASDGKLSTFIRPYLSEDLAKALDAKPPLTFEFRPANGALNRR